MKKWKLISDIKDVEKIKVFSGGACNIRDEKGIRIRNPERDTINEWLTKSDIYFFDPQIHPDTHGVEYEYKIHAPLETAARKTALVNVFEVSPRTFGGVTSLEIAVDRFSHHDPTVLFFADGDLDRDVIPVHSTDGYPLFEPDGIKDNNVAAKAHYVEFLKNANRMRRYLIQFALEVNALTITFGEQVFEGDVVISPHRMHAVDMFTAVVKAASGQRVIVNFVGGEHAQDEDGIPIMVIPENPLPTQLQTYLDQYVDEGNQLRRAMCDLIKVNVLTRIVYTQRAAILALNELLNVKGVMELDDEYNPKTG